ncbi:MFS transporter [Paeniglutamicibacter gangotriensis]|uniref:Major facilitator superfamily protein YbfB n=1 Tax=Paeniglutamicibacter gangotriensis Lz1y TaxID=1276920 RepID=M7MQU5_9MICC|nr:MFS transporter [Paeniglutamicibacter gangotriensis]EMQ97436.1 major facilitator superfamily protein YbfB [Paeniglutamicibacter gangotriensis Lz1y]
METTVKNPAPRSLRTEFSQGWQVLLFATVGAGVGFSSLGYILGPLVVPLQEEFGWGRGEITLTSLWSSLGMALALPFMGRLLDRFGVKRVALVSLPMFAAVLFALSQFESTLLIFLVLYGLTGILGVGTSAVTYAKAIVEKFDTMRGLGLGIMATGLGAAGLTLPPLVSALVSLHGWRSVYFALGLLGLVPLVLLIFTKLPHLPRQNRVPQEHAGFPGMPRPQTKYGREFWTLMVSFFMLGWALLTMVPHFVPMLIDSGITPMRAALLSSFIGVGTVIGRPIIGWLMDRFYATHVAVPLFAATALGCVLLLLAGPQYAALTAVLIGIGFGAEIDLMSYLSSRYFRPHEFGTLYSYVYSAFMIGSALGPVVAGFIFDSTKSYNIPLIMATTLLLLGSVVLLSLPRYDQRISELNTQPTTPALK